MNGRSFLLRACLLACPAFVNLALADSRPQAGPPAERPRREPAMSNALEEQVTDDPKGHILTNVGVWSPDSRRIVYDVRSDAAGGGFNGDSIETVDVRTREVRVLYKAARGAKCGVVTYSPVAGRVVFIHGPEDPTPDWQYGAAHRRGVIVDESRPGRAVNLDACDLTPPFTPGALRGGSHVHVFSADGRWVSFTYQDAVLERIREPAPDGDVDQRNVGVSVPAGPVRVGRDHPRNHDGSHFSVLVSRTVARPRPGSDEIAKAFEESWVGSDGYLKPDGSRQKRALAFQGDVLGGKGDPYSEVFIVDLPEDVTRAGEGALEGTATTRPRPPKGAVQRRLTRTEGRRYPGIQGPRHWLRTSPDGSRIAFLMKDDGGVVQLWTVSPNGGAPAQVTHNAWSVASAFTWSPDGRRMAHVMDNSVCVTDVGTGSTARLTPRTPDPPAPRSEACVYSPDGKKIAYLRSVLTDGKAYNQVFVCHVPEAARR
jgi:hypothetical protein